MASDQIVNNLASDQKVKQLASEKAISDEKILQQIVANQIALQLNNTKITSQNNIPLTGKENIKENPQYITVNIK